MMGQRGHNTYSENRELSPPGIPPRIARMPASVRAWKEIEWKMVGSTKASGQELDHIGERELDQENNHTQEETDKDGSLESSQEPNGNKTVDTESKSPASVEPSTEKQQTSIHPLEEKELREDLYVPVERTSSIERRIHILGIGPTGKFVAHALASLSERPHVSLLIDREDVRQRWHDEGQLIEVLQGKSSDVQAGFDVEPLLHTWHSKSPIGMLIVTTRPSQTVPLLRILKPRLGPGSTICFLQNSMGIMDDVTEMVFPDSLSRPRYLCGTTSHLLTPSARTFTTEHKKGGEIWLSLVPRPRFGHEKAGLIPYKDTDPFLKKMFYEWSASSRKLMRNMTRSTHLQAKGLQYRDLLEIQLERLAISAIVEPLCVIFDCACGDLLKNFSVTRLIADLLSEITTVIRALPEFAESEVLHIDEYFDPRRIEYLVFQYVAASKRHIPDMLVNLRKGQRSEIEWLNGYILRRADDVGIQCPVNQSVFQMVKAKEIMMLRKLDNYVSWDGF